MLDTDINDNLNTQSSMQRLQNYQTEFYQMMVHGDDSKIQRHVGSTLDWQLGVYQNNYRQCLLSILHKTFKRTHDYLVKNRADVNDVFEAYILTTPSSQQNLALYGAKFSHWLKTRARQDRILQIAADLAELDYCLYQCYYAANSHPFEIDVFIALDDADKLNAQFQRIASINLLESQWNLVELDSAETVEAMESTGMESTGQANSLYYYMVYRALGIAKFQAISIDLYLLLSELSEAKSLQHISDNPLFNTEQNMPKLIQNQWVVMT
jgi:hypothetical protein